MSYSLCNMVLSSCSPHVAREGCRVGWVSGCNCSDEVHFHNHRDVCSNVRLGPDQLKPLNNLQWPSTARLCFQNIHACSQRQLKSWKQDSTLSLIEQLAKMCDLRSVTCWLCMRSASLCFSSSALDLSASSASRRADSASARACLLSCAHSSAKCQAVWVYMQVKAHLEGWGVRGGGGWEGGGGLRGRGFSRLCCQ